MASREPINITLLSEVKFITGPGFNCLVPSLFKIATIDKLNFSLIFNSPIVLLFKTLI